MLSSEDGEPEDGTLEADVENGSEPSSSVEEATEEAPAEESEEDAS